MSSHGDAPRLVVDSSVVVKWFLSEGESGVDEALALLDRHRRGDVVLAAPDLLLYEVSSAMDRRGVSPARQLDVASALFKMNLELERLSELHRDAVSLSVEHGVSVYDAAFAALARRIGGRLVSADQKLVASGACDAVRLGEE